MGDVIVRHISQVLTIDQIETLTNKTIDGDFNTLSDIPHTALKKITDKAKLHDNLVYNDDPTSQSFEDHEDIQFDGLLDGNILRYNGTTGKWYNDNLVESGGTGDVTGASNVGASGVGVFFQEVSGVLQFSKLKSETSALTIALDSNVLDFTIADATTSVKGIIQIATDGVSNSAQACSAADTRLSNSRTPTSHATSHKSAGGDVIKLDELGAPTDITTLNASTSAHGLIKKLSNIATEYMDGTGNWSVPSSSSISSFKAKNVNEISFSSTTALQNMLQYSFAANEMGTDLMYEYSIEGTYLNDSGGSPKLNVKISFDTTVMWQHEIGTISSSSTRRVFRIVGKFFNKGVHNSQQVTGDIALSDSSAPTNGLGRANDDEMNAHGRISGSATVATNSLAKVFKIEMNHDTSNSTIIFTRTLSYIREVK